MSITRIEVSSIEELKKISQMTKQESKDLENWKDEYDEDCPPSTPEQLAQFKRVEPSVKHIRTK